MKLDDYLPLKEYAAKINRNPVTVLQKIQRGGIPGAIKVGKIWLIPVDAEYTDGRITTGQYKDWRKTK